MIFRVIKVYRGIKEGSKDPSGFAKNEALDALRGIIIPFTILGICIVGVFFALGYTSFWFGPAGFFKVLSIISLIAFLGWVVLSQIILMFAKQLLRHAKQKVDSHVFHHDINKNT